VLLCWTATDLRNQVEGIFDDLPKGWKSLQKSELYDLVKDMFTNYGDVMKGATASTDVQKAMMDAIHTANDKSRVRRASLRVGDAPAAAAVRVTQGVAMLGTGVCASAPAPHTHQRATHTPARHAHTSAPRTHQATSAITIAHHSCPCRSAGL
jgi:hypothetical protein